MSCIVAWVAWAGRAVRDSLVQRGFRPHVTLVTLLLTACATTRLSQSSFAAVLCLPEDGG